jgi:hypothetical protein
MLEVYIIKEIVPTQTTTASNGNGTAQAEDRNAIETNN